LIGPAALAQGTAVLTGTIVDASDPKKILGDAVVTATSPNLQGEQIVVTDATGLYRIPQLPPGTYTLRVEKEGYRPFSRGDIVVNSDRTLRVNISLLPDSISAEEITVVGRAPTIDIGSSSTGRTINNDFVRNIAVARPGGVGGASRSFESLALTVPQAQGDTYGVSVNGASSPESSYLVDGLSVNNPAYGINGSRTPAEFMQEVNVITGGFMPEYGRSTGGTLSAVTKTGSNEFHGSIWGNLSPGILITEPRWVNSTSTSIATRSRQWNIIDFGASLGGPIIKDKLWFFVGFQPSFSRYAIDRAINRLDTDAEGNVTPTQLASSSRFADQRSFDYLANLTYLFNSDHRIRLSLRGSPTNSGGPNTWGFDPQQNIPNIRNRNNGQFEALNNLAQNNSTDVSLNLNSSFLDKKVLVDTSLGWHNQYVSSLPIDGSKLGDSTGLAGRPSITWNKSANAADPNTFAPHSITEFESFDPAAMATCTPQLCPALGYVTGGTGFLQVVNANSYQAKVIATVLANGLGHHVIKAGFDGMVTNYDNNKAYTGLTALQEDGFGRTFFDVRRYGYLNGPDQPVQLANVRNFSHALSLGGFIQDSWSIMDVVTANVGVRYDSQVLRGADGRNGLSLPNQWSPRVGLVYDFTQKGQSKLYANYSLYYENVPLDLADRALSSEPQIRSTYNAAGCNGVTDPGSCPTDANRLPRTGVRNPNQYYGIVGADITAVDRQIRAPTAGEFVAGFEYELLSNVRASVSYTHRNLFTWIEDMSRDNATTYFIGNPGEGIATDFPKATRDYDAVTLAVQKEFSDLWLLQASYTWSSLRGNLDGLFRPEDGQLDPNINSTFDLAQFLTNQTGPLSGDNTHRFKVYAAREIVVAGGLSLSVGMGYEGRSGSPISYLGANNDPGYGTGVIFILPRGAAGRLPWRHDFDGRLAVNYRLGKDYLLTASVDVFNLLNSQQTVRVDEDYTVEGVLPVENGTVDDLTRIPREDGNFLTEGQKNNNFGNPVTFQPPRSFRFGIRLTF
ncbi:MAG: TonB-dependent receptor, partial [Myxococcaceae bacterium]